MKLITQIRKEEAKHGLALSVPRSTSQLPRRRSFTLIEILIAATIFTGIVVLSVGAFTDSISLNSGASAEFGARQAARQFFDYLTRQINQSSTNTITIDPDCTIYQEPDGSCPGYEGSGFLLFNYDQNSGKMLLPNVSTGQSANSILIPLRSKTDVGVSTVYGTSRWFYVGTQTNVALGSGCCIFNNAVGDPNPPGNGNHLLNRNNMQYGSQLELIPGVVVKSLTFKGINPRGTEFNADGTVKSYSVQAQPYVTVVLQLAPKSDKENVATYETTITLRDYKFAFPQCSKINDPTVTCQ